MSIFKSLFYFISITICIFSFSCTKESTEAVNPIDDTDKVNAQDFTYALSVYADVFKFTEDLFIQNNSGIFEFNTFE